MCITLTHWGLVTHICISNLTIIFFSDDLSPGRCLAIIWTNAAILIIGPLGTHFSEILIEILTFSFKKTLLKMLSVKRRPFCLHLNVLIPTIQSLLFTYISWASYYILPSHLVYWFQSLFDRDIWIIHTVLTTWMHHIWFPLKQMLYITMAKSMEWVSSHFISLATKLLVQSLANLTAKKPPKL